MDTFGQVAQITFVFLLWCTEQDANTETHRRRTRSTTTTQSYEDYLLEKKAKLLYFEYYPNYGYEPYWADGEWVLSTTKVPGTTTKKIKVCGEECGYLLRRIHKVCGRLSNDVYLNPYGCGSEFWNWQSAMSCSGKPGEDFNRVYRTFDTYCEFLNAQCRSKFYDEQRWVLVNVGKCKQLDDYFKPLWTSDQPVSRQAFYLSSLIPSTLSTRPQ